LKSKCENEAKKQDAVRDMTHDVQLIYFKENYVQKDLVEREKQVKKNDGKTSNDGDASTHPSCDDVSDGGATDAHPVHPS
jgi:hypothetical protein